MSAEADGAALLERSAYEHYITLASDGSFIHGLGSFCKKAVLAMQEMEMLMAFVEVEAG